MKLGVLTVNITCLKSWKRLISPCHLSLNVFDHSKKLKHIISVRYKVTASEVNKVLHCCMIYADIIYKYTF